jgi:hypothetical protein
MPLNVDRINEYIKGNKFKKLLQANSKIDQAEMDKYKEFLMPSNKPNREYALLKRHFFYSNKKKLNQIF